MSLEELESEEDPSEELSEELSESLSELLLSLTTTMLLLERGPEKVVTFERQLRIHKVLL